MRTVHPQRREAHPYDQIVRNAFTLITADVERTRWIVKAVLEVECAETYDKLESAFRFVIFLTVP